MKVFKVIVYLLLAAVVILAAVNNFGWSAAETGEPVELIDSTSVDTPVTTLDTTVAE